MNITIKNASIKNSLFLKYGYDHFVGSTKYSHPSTTGDAPIHEDLREAFLALTPHFAFICEEISESVCRQAIDDYIKGVFYQDAETDPLRKYTVIGFTLGKDSEGVTIIGSKRLESGKSISIPTPFMKWDDDYAFDTELIAAVDLLKSEVYEYIEGKRAPAQHQTGNMFEQDEEEEKEAFADADQEM
ncbi:hypothetical protein [Flavobacterium crassostreae]|uniref:Uncharacterized protein n=1 Tax=Flavobacterium crassostreae TaxID=1763534 RepID=A0A1B9E7V6_9FLAO|nr:hypothetical protein [Flavobacterium crassostreae]OCB77991.1 hypothetical protein LPBF_03315 [Flavobacterium crassostreae]